VLTERLRQHRFWSLRHARHRPEMLIHRLSVDHGGLPENPGFPIHDLAGRPPTRQYQMLILMRVMFPRLPGFSSDYPALPIHVPKNTDYRSSAMKRQHITASSHLRRPAT